MFLILIGARIAKVRKLLNHIRLLHWILICILKEGCHTISKSCVLVIILL
ncbi:hypothetical protein Golax_016438 [Gossypium laxum]|uniref:Uncharacterized protein n=1 Tax=Gossypium laxum TaxID=34288 RepID=A0A7J8YXD6_9ROSI|nr:hypothetical protein [Gossypium laxum]